ncbi:MAG: septum formation family protein [Acidimicrobiales bacterium]
MESPAPPDPPAMPAPIAGSSPAPGPPPFPPPNPAYVGPPPVSGPAGPSQPMFAPPRLGPASSPLPSWNQPDAPAAFHPGKRSPWALVSVIAGGLGLVLCIAIIPSVVALVAGIVGVATAGKPGYQAGTKRLAGGGIVLGVLGLIVGGIYWGDFLERGEGIDQVRAALADGFDDLQVGDCVIVPADGNIYGLAEEPCDEPHGGEVYFISDLQTESLPTSDAVANRCADSFVEFIGVDFETSSLDLFYTMPSAASWATGDRRYHCIATTIDGSKLPAGSVKGSRI